MSATAPSPAYLRVLGPVELSAGAGPVDLGGVRSRALITALALTPGDVAPADRLIALVWGAEPPKTAANQLQIAVHRVRTALTEAGLDAHDTLRREGGGYVLDGLGVDLADFRAHVTDGEKAAASGEWTEARASFRTALDLWRGPACPDLAGTAAVDGVEEERLAALEQRMIADLLEGDAAPVLADAPGLLATHPYRERAAHLLVLAHALAGDRARARAELTRVRTAIVEDLGIDPGPELRDLDPDGELAPAVDRLRAWSAGPAPTPLVRPRELPAHVRDFVGRPAELTALAAGLEAAATGTGAVLTVVGLGGVGKTALAVHAAHAASARFPDGCLFADLRGAEPEPRDPHAVLAVFLRSLGVPDDAVPDDADGRTSLYRRLLTGKRVLIVCDNAHDAEQVRPLLPGTEGTAVIVTGRARLSPLEPAVAVDLDALGEDDAVELLTRLSRGAAHDPARLRELAALTGGLPLALRILGARIARRGFHLDRIIARLTDEQRRLDTLSDGDQRVRSCVDFGYRRLSAPAASMLRTTALLPATDVGLWLVAATMGVTTAEAAPIAAELEEAQLARVSDGVPIEARLLLHDLVRVYARGEAGGERERLPRGHEVLLALAGEAAERLPYTELLPPPTPADIAAPDEASIADVRTDPGAWFGREREVLVEVVSGTDPELAWRLGVATANYLEQWSHTDDLRLIRDRLAAIGGSLGAEGDRHRRYFEMMVLAVEGRLRESLPIARRLRRDFDRAGDGLRAAMAANAVAGALRQQARRERAALANLNWAMRRLDGLPPGPRVENARGWLQSNLAVFAMLEDLERARLHCLAAIEHFRRAGDRVGEGQALATLGAVHQRRGELPEAVAHYRDARAIYVELGVTLARLRCDALTADAHLVAGRPDAALGICEDVLGEMRRLTEPLFHAGVIQVKATALKDMGRHDEALATIAEGIALTRELGMRHQESRLLGARIGVQVDLGDRAAASADLGVLRGMVSPGDPVLKRAEERVAALVAG